MRFGLAPLMPGKRLAQAPQYHLFLALALALTASASPLVVDGDAGSHVRVRGLKMAGTPCQASSECYSANCAPTNGGSTLTCHRQPIGGPCFRAGNCLSRNCTAAVCAGPAGLMGTCTSDTECGLFRTVQLTCATGLCKVPVNGICSADKHCVSGRCRNSSCLAPLIAPNARCSSDDQCASGRCTPYSMIQCLNPDGSYIPPGKESYCGVQNNYHGGAESFCARFALGHPCSCNGDCNEGFCSNGLCSSSKVGDSCLTQLQCTGDQVCGTDAKCFVPAAKSLSYGANCSLATQCSSGRCQNPVYKDQNGFNIGTLPSLTNRTRCDYLQNGEDGCKSFLDCDTGICNKNGTCQLGSDGDRCIANYQCKGLCSLAGLCFNPAKGQRFGADQPVKKATQCLSAAVDGSRNITRPSATDPMVNIFVTDTVCAQSFLGGKCAQNQDCYEGLCSNNSKCARAPLGTTCSSSNACLSHFCDIEPGTISGICGLGAANAPCEADADCFTDLCTTKKTCAPAANQAACRPTVTYDCDLGQTCTPDGKCLSSFGQKCTRSIECTTGVCTRGFCDSGS